MKIITHESHWTMTDIEGRYIAIPRDGRWQFDGNIDAPTFSPSINESSKRNEDVPEWRSHFFVRGGKVEYLDDSTHAGKGRTLELMEVEESSSGFVFVPKPPKE